MRAREFARVCERAGLGHRTLKDLRDNWACPMLTAGVPLAYVAKQLGHSVATCVQHYGEWCEEDHRDPMVRGEKVPANFLARLETPVALTTNRYRIQIGDTLPEGGVGDPGRIRICDLRLRRPE